MGKTDKLSVFMSLVLRHKPDAAGISLDEHGWANVEELLVGINNTGRKIDMEILEEIVATDNKQRYSFKKENRVDLLILGAYGCGVFGQDAKEVAEIFKEYLDMSHKCFEKVIFAILKGRDKNYEAFEGIFVI